MQITYSFVKCSCSFYFPQFCKSDISRFGYLEVFQITRVDYIMKINEQTWASLLEAIANTLDISYVSSPSILDGHLDIHKLNKPFGPQIPP